MHAGFVEVLSGITSHIAQLETSHATYLCLVLYHASGSFNVVPKPQIARHEEHVTRHTLHVTRHKSRVNYHTSPQSRDRGRAAPKHHVASSVPASALTASCAAHAACAVAAGCFRALQLQDVAVSVRRRVRGASDDQRESAERGL
jgi:hypothetical protein